MLTRADAPIIQYQGIFQSASAKLGSDLFKPAGVLFSKSISTLQNVTTDKQSYDKYLDKAYMEDVAQFGSCKDVSNATVAQLHLPLLALLWFCFKIFV